MGIRIVHELEPYRMITDDAGHYAVLEARGGRVYSIHGHDRREAPDTPEGMAWAARDAWRDRARAAQRLLYMARGEKRYGETLW